MTITDFKVGDRIQIHPASDWFMRGVRYATVTHVRTRDLVVTSDSGKTFKIHPNNVTEIVDMGHAND